MNILTWNLNHRTRQKPISPSIAEAITSLHPDIVVLTEYVPGPSHEKFIEELSDGHLRYIRVSHFTPKENHILIASRKALNDGIIKAPSISPSFPSNVLHVFVPELGLQVLGLRIPDYSKQLPLRNACWDWIETQARGMRDYPSIILGDFNTDPSYPPAKCGNRINQMVIEGWQHAQAVGSSYWTVNGNIGKQLDHAFFSRHFEIDKTEYILETCNYIIAGKESGALSDHAILFVKLH